MSSGDVGSEMSVLPSVLPTLRPRKTRFPVSSTRLKIPRRALWASGERIGECRRWPKDKKKEGNHIGVGSLY